MARHRNGLGVGAPALITMLLCALFPGCSDETGSGEEQVRAESLPRFEGQSDEADDEADDDTWPPLPDDGTDDDAPCVDLDGDGYGTNCPQGEDCDDGDPDRQGLRVAYYDADFDSYPGTPKALCDGDPMPLTWAWVSTDCDDSDPTVNPGMFDFPDDGIDNDCSGGDSPSESLELLYVDGNRGDDANPGTKARPMKTINAGATAAAYLGADGVAVSEGIYSEDVTTGVSLFGAYKAGGWTRGVSEYVSVVEPVSANATIAIFSDAEPVVIHGFTIRVPDGLALARGVLATGSNEVIVASNVMEGGSGAAVRSIAAYETETAVVGNDIEFGAGEEITGVYIANELATSSSSRIIANRIHGGLNATDSVDGVVVGGNSWVASNDIELFTSAELSYGIDRFTEGGHQTANVSVVNNNIIISGEPTYATGVFNEFSFGSTVQNQIIIDSPSGILQGIISSRCMENTVMITCQENCIGTGISGVEAAGLQVGNEIQVSATMSTGILDFVAFFTSSLSVINNTISVEGELLHGAYGINIFAMPFFPSYISLNVVNNSIVSSEFGIGAVFETYLPPAATMDANIINNNIYIDGTGAMVYVDAGIVETADELNQCSWNYCSSAYGNTGTEPGYVDIENGDHHLNSDSQLIDAGIWPIPDAITIDPILRVFPWFLYPRDQDGTWRPQGQSIDIGADEYVP